MNRHYVNAALHSLSRSPAYTVISLMGLAVAFASLLLIGAYVRTELTHDQWVAGHENVYRLGKRVAYGGQELASNSMGAAEPLWLKQDIPEVETVARLYPRTQQLRRDAVEIHNTVVWADPEIFSVLTLPLLAGDPLTALQDSDSLVITRGLARRLLLTGDAIGQQIEVDGQPMRITAVLDALPGPSHLSIEALASSNSSRSGLVVQGTGGSGWGEVHAFVRIAPGAFAAVRNAIPALVDRRISHASPELRGTPESERVSNMFSYTLQPLAGMHMQSQKGMFVPNPTDMFRPTGDMSLVLALAAIALLILVVATANFANIMSVRAAQRTIEIGMRKVTGASRLQLVGQFVGESTVLAAVGAGIGILAGLLCLRGFGAYLDRELAPAFLLDPVFAAGLLLSVLLAGVLGGLYPALVMSSSRPAQMLRGAPALTSHAGVLRHASVIFQFALLIALVVAVLVIGRQVSYLLQENFRVDTDQLLYVQVGGRCDDVLRDRVAALPGTAGAACAEDSMLSLDSARVVPAALPDGTPFRFHIISMGPGALELLGVQLLAGRYPAGFAASSLQSQDGAAGARGVLVNHAAVRNLGLASPEAAIGQPMPGSLGPAPPIIGVVDDFPMRSLRDPIAPVVFQPTGFTSLLLVKLDGTDMQQTLRDIEQVWRTSGREGPFRSQFHDQFLQRLYEDVARMKQLCTAFSIIAALIAALGIYGLSALAVEHGAMGVGVRKAFGASRADVLQLLLWRFTVPIVVASLVAWPISYWIMRRWLEGFAYHIDLGPGLFLAASMSALVVALAAVIGHALQLARVRPVVALSHR